MSLTNSEIRRILARKTGKRGLNIGIIRAIIRKERIERIKRNVADNPSVGFWEEWK